MTREALLIAKTPLEIEALEIKLNRSQTTFITEAQYKKAEARIKDLVNIHALRVEWVDRERQRRVPTMRQPAHNPHSRPMEPSNIYRPNMPVENTQHVEMERPLPPAPEPLPQVVVTATPGSINQKLDHIQEEVSKLGELSEMIRELRSNVEFLRSLIGTDHPALSNQRLTHTPALSIPSDEDAPVFIPSKILGEDISDSTEISIQDTRAEKSDLNESAAALKSARRGAKK